MFNSLPGSIVVVLSQVVGLEIKDPREAAAVGLVHQKDLHTLALDEALHVRQDSEHHVLNRALLLENHSRQIQQDLIPLHLQLRLFVQLRIPQPDSAELQVRCKDLKDGEEVNYYLLLLSPWPWYIYSPVHSPSRRFP